jgi:hypothetical protein
MNTYDIHKLTVWDLESNMAHPGHIEAKKTRYDFSQMKR